PVLPGPSKFWWIDGNFFQAGRTGFVGDQQNQSLRGMLTRLVGSVNGSFALWLPPPAAVALLGVGGAGANDRGADRVVGARRRRARGVRRVAGLLVAEGGPAAGRADQLRPGQFLRARRQPGLRRIPLARPAAPRREPLPASRPGALRRHPGDRDPVGGFPKKHPECRVRGAIDPGVLIVVRSMG